MINSLSMSRARLYVLLDAFERDVRAMLEKYVSSEIGEEACLGASLAACKAKRDRDPESTNESLVTYLDMREAYDLLNTHREMLPNELAVEARDLTGNLDSLVGIRNRVMHARPLAAGDGELAVSLLNQFHTRQWVELRRVLAKLQADPLWEPTLGVIKEESPTLHNLPLADYDDTGLVGRAKEVEELVGLLKRRREPVVTITGEGGIGKTALAVEVGYRLVDDPDTPFEAILWTSLKHEKLTAFGVREIAGAARELIGAIQPIGAVFDAGFEGDVGELAQLLDGIKVLLVLDNLETVSGEEFKSLYNALPDTVSYLVTSRIGVGEYERRFPLGMLGDKDSLELFNQFVKARRIQTLSRLSGEARVNVVRELRYSPLAIKWFALAVEAGNEPLSLIRHQDELLEFCVRSVYDELSEPAREVLNALAILARPLPTDELVVLLDRPLDDVSRGIQELLRGSLVRQQQKGGSDELLFQVLLTETATQFLGRRVQLSETTKEKLERKDRYYRDVQSRRELDIANRSLAPYVVRQRSDTDAPTCAVLRQAIISARNASDPAEAFSKLDLARTLNPDFWEVDRVEGFIRNAFGDVAGATSSYERAYANSLGEDRAVVAYFFAGHLARKARDVARAIQFATEAHQVLDNSETGIALGNFLVWAHRFTEGIELLEKAVPRSIGRTHVISISALAEGWRRYSEASGADGRNYLDQYNQARKGFEISDAALEAGISDYRLSETAADCAGIAIRAASMCIRQGNKVTGLPTLLSEIEDSLSRMYGTSRWATVAEAADRLANSHGAPVAARKLQSSIRALEESMPGVDLSDDDLDLVGEIHSLKEQFGFIRHASFPQNVFFHSNVVRVRGGFDSLSLGMPVRFRAEEGDKGPRATFVGSVAKG